MNDRIAIGFSDQRPPQPTVGDYMRREFMPALLREIADVIQKDDDLVAYNWEMREIDVQGTLYNLSFALQARADEIEREARKE